MKYALKKVRRIIINDLATKEHKVTLNDLKTLQITGSQDVVYAEGQDGAKLASFDVSKVASITAENGAIDEGFIALQVGADVVKVTNGTAIKYRQEVEITDDSTTTVTLTYSANGTTGNEIGYIYKADANGLPSTSYTQNATASATQFSYVPDTKVLTLPTDAFVKGDTVIIDYYPMFSEYEEIANDSDKFSFSCEVIVDAWFTDLCTDVDVPLQLYLPKGKISGEIDLSAGDQAAVQNVSIEALTKSCGETKNLWTLRKYDLSNAS